jgi:signal transduction histidine kinase
LHKLLTHQLRNLTRVDGSIDAEGLVAAVERTYVEFDRERRLNDRAARLMEEELQNANIRVKKLGEQKLADALESVPSAIAVLSADYRIQTINLAMAGLCAGLPSPPGPGDDFIVTLAALSSSIDAQAGLTALRSGRTLELKIKDKWYLTVMRSLADGGYALALSDVSPLKERESALAMARDAAESANRLKSKFLATMSHELRTPLNAILGFSEVIRDQVLGKGEKTSAKYLEYAGAIHSSGTHLLELISEVLDLSKIESGSYDLALERFDLADLVQVSLLLVQPQACRGDVEIKPLRKKGTLTVEADQRAIKQVIVNLLSNAVKFTPPGGKVEIACTEREDAVHVEVRDTGIGIAANFLESVFEPFHQGDANVARRYEGTGLGLSVCRGLIEMHGGEIRLESALSVGTRAHFHLPKAFNASKASAA